MTSGIVAKNARLFDLPLRWKSELPAPFENTQLTFNARTAIWQGLKIFSFQPGDRILVPAYHCGSEVDTLIKYGLKPIFYKLNSDLSVNSDHIRVLLREKTAALYVIHYFGYPQPVKELSTLAKEAECVLIEDLALGLYSKNNLGEALGARADMVVSSLVKTLAVPEGGSLSMSRNSDHSLNKSPSFLKTAKRTKSLIKRAKSIRPEPPLQILNEWDPAAALDLKTTNLRASFLTRLIFSHLDHEKIATARAWKYDYLYKNLPNTSRIKPLMAERPNGTSPAYFPLWTSEQDAAMDQLRYSGIEAIRFWRRPHPDVELEEFPFEAGLRQQVIRLPIHDGITLNDLDKIIASVQRISDSL